MIKRSLLLPMLFVAGSLHAQDKAPDLAQAKQTAETVCAGCHNADGNSTLAANPKLAGQIPEYLLKQLKDFKSWNGKEPERNNAIMSAMAAPYSEDEMRGLAAYFSSQKQNPEPARNGKTLELGQKIWRSGIASKGVPACAGCHGPAGAGLPAQYPRLSGQFAEYMETQLKSFRDGTRANDPAKMMRMIAIKMTDPEIQAVADYAAGLR